MARRPVVATATALAGLLAALPLVEPASAQTDIELLGMAMGADGSLPDEDAIERASIVPDGDLADMRGRFIQSGQIVFFGLQIVSSWQSGDGMILTTGLDLSVGLPVSRTEFSAIATFSSTDAGEGGGPPAAPAEEPETIGPNIGALDSVTGIVQSVSVEGHGNGIINNLQLSIVAEELTGNVAIQDAIGAEVLEITGTTSRVSQTGTIQKITIDDNTLGVDIEIPGKGTVQQRISGAEFNQIAQHVDLSGSFHLIENRMNINFQLNAISSSARSNITAALEAIRGLGF